MTTVAAYAPEPIDMTNYAPPDDGVDDADLHIQVLLPPGWEHVHVTPVLSIATKTVTVTDWESTDRT